jgi:hypothetical protein
MAISAQDKIMYVANKLGLSSLKYMQASTGAVYDGNTAASASHTLFENAVQHASPAVTNLNDNRFEVNEALLIETISFYSFDPGTNNTKNLSTQFNSDSVIVFDLIIGNKVVMKDVPVWAAGGPVTFGSSGFQQDIAQNDTLINRHQVYMEGAGILIPPQVEFQVNAKIYSSKFGSAVSAPLGCYLFGTKVLLNFNTTI